MTTKPQLRLLKCFIDIAQRPRTACLTTCHLSSYGKEVRSIQRRSFYAAASRAQAVSDETTANHTFTSNLDLLPRTCPGCGALTHNDPSNKTGYYGRRSIKDHIRRLVKEEKAKERRIMAIGELPADAVQAASNLDEEIPERGGILSQSLCDRCHELSNQNKGRSISHPTVESIAAIIDESPFHHNHVYHVLDAADFPASLIPGIFEQLSLVQQRSQNRRAKSTMYKAGHRTTVSFIITRSDILLPLQEQTDRLMPYFVRTLRNALGRDNERARMGNVHLVSSKRGWWTKELKAEIWKRGGANWMVGKVNVGKSNLFEVLYPKGSGEAEPDFGQLREDALTASESMSSVLMPPSQPLVPYPTLPLVSSLPGTTASPIRLPYATYAGKLGELIDLPGLFRSPLEPFVTPNHRQSLVMNKRPHPDSITIRPHQSLLIGGGLVRITPYSSSNDASSTTDLDRSERSTDLTIQAHSFLPAKIPVHLTSTTKALEIESGSRKSGIDTILDPSVNPDIRSAGIFTLDKDVTKSHAAKLLQNGPRQERSWRKVEDLPFRVFATDVVIEGIGWVELTAQVRASKHDRIGQRVGEDGHHATEMDQPIDTGKNPFAREEKVDQKIDLPKVQIFTPGGKGVLQRETAGIWNILSQGVKPKST